jgi:hypothetical protein
MNFYKIKKIIVPGRVSTTGRGYGPSTARGSCRVGPYTIKWVVPRASSPDTVHLAIYTTIMMIIVLVVTTSFVILFFFSFPTCLHLRARSFSTEGVGAGVSSPYSSDTNSRSGYCTSTRTFHIMCAPSFSPSSDVSFVFPAFTLFFLLNLLPPPTVAATSRPTLVDAGTKRVGHAPGLSPCVSSRRTWWRLSRLGYIGDEESRSKILDNQGS